MAGPIQGITYTKSQTEYQYFPEEYFSGSDVTIYFGDIWIDEVTGLQFGLTEKILPIYGYNSYTWDASPRGNRIVQGTFSIAFKESGYLYRIFEHLGQIKQNAKPQIAYMLGDQSAPAWIGNVKERMQDVINRVNSPTAASTSSPTPTGVPNLQPCTFGDTGDNVIALQQYIQANPGKFNPPSAWGATSSDIAKIKIRLNGYLRVSGAELIPEPLAINNDYLNPEYTNAVMMFQSNFSHTLDRTGQVSSRTLEYLNKGFDVTGIYDAATKLTIMRFQAANGLSTTGHLDAATIGAFTTTVNVKSKSSGGGTSAQQQMADIEGTIWGETSQQNDKSGDTYFYNTDNQQWLKLEGFDIYINYGPLPEAIEQNGGKLPDKVSFNTAIRVIRNVQIQSVGQVLNPDGQPIQEVYSFIARDLD